MRKDLLKIGLLALLMSVGGRPASASLVGAGIPLYECARDNAKVAVARETKKAKGRFLGRDFHARAFKDIPDYA